MSFKVVCISATDGALRDEIGPAVATGLGFRLVNEQIVAEAAKEAGVAGHVMADVEQSRSVIGRVIHELLSAKPGGVSHGFTVPVTADSTPPTDSLRGLIRSVIEEIADRGNAVIVAHAASHALEGRPDALRVLITAGPATRRDRIKAERKLSDKEAEKRVARGDANRADYIKRFYQVSPELPTHYDIVLNSDRLSADQAVDIIVRAASVDLAAPRA